MEYVSSCQATQIWENLCIEGIKRGFAERTHDGKTMDNEFYTRTYEISIKASIYPLIIKFWYDKREKEDKDKGKFRKDVAAVKISFHDLILLLEALSNKEFDLQLPDFNVSMSKEGLKIQQK